MKNIFYFGLTLGTLVTLLVLMNKADNETKAEPQTVELSKDEKTTKLKEAIYKEISQNKTLDQLPKYELAKYIDFPQWMPVTKDGWFSWDKASEMFDAAGLNKPEVQQAFKEYKAALKKGTKPNIALQKFAEQIAGGDQEKSAQLKQLAKILQNMPTETQEKETIAIMATGLLALGVTFVAAGGLLMKETVKKEGRRYDRAWNSQPSIESGISGFAALAFVAMGLATGAIGGCGGCYYAAKLGLREVYQITARDLYRVHVDQEIQKAFKPKVVQKGTNQTKQAIELSKQKSPEK